MDATAVAAELEAADAPAVVPHRHADRDAVGAAVGLAALVDAPATVCLPEGIAAPAQPLVSDRGPVETIDPATHDLLVVVDAPSSDRIAPVDPFDPLVVIDHHAYGDLAERATARVIDRDAGSTAELVHRIARVAGWELSTAAAYPLVVGILDDTGFLQAAGPIQIEHVVELLPHVAGREDDLAAMFDPSPQPGERTARVKATARASFYTVGDRTLAVTHVGGFETAAAHALRDVGVDCALVWSGQSDGVRVVGRCAGSFAERLSLGEELLPTMADAADGSGGGHDTAAAAQGLDLPSDAVEDTIVAAVEEGLEAQAHRLAPDGQ
jgi:nanoRNase/pAp phosphatase (c-di-AMP/oligoRNAs hydrolase)